MREAGLTHGGFYKHFGSREDLVAEATDDAFAYAERTLDKYARDERDPLAAWVDWYLSAEHRDDPASGCPVAALAGDVDRGNDHVRRGYDALVERYIGSLEGMLGDGDGDDATTPGRPRCQHARRIARPRPRDRRRHAFRRNLARRT